MSAPSCEFAERLDELALGGLTELERHRILEHLRVCPPCAAEAGDYLEGLSVIALSAPQLDPPSSLGRLILSEAGSDMGRPGRTSLRSRWPHWVAAAAAILTLVSLGWSVQLSRELESQRAQFASLSRRYDTVVGVLAATDVRIQPMVGTTAAPSSMGRIFIDRESGSGMMMHRLPPLPEGQVYQLWFIRKGERVNGGILRTNPDGTGYTIFQSPGPVREFEEVGVTREPAGGSTAPTTDRLLGTGI